MIGTRVSVLLQKQVQDMNWCQGHPQRHALSASALLPCSRRQSVALCLSLIHI